MWLGTVWCALVERQDPVLPLAAASEESSWAHYQRRPLAMWKERKEEGAGLPHAAASVHLDLRMRQTTKECCRQVMKDED